MVSDDWLIDLTNKLSLPFPPNKCISNCSSMYIKNVLTWGRRPTRKIKGKPRINPAKKEKQIKQRFNWLKHSFFKSLWELLLALGYYLRTRFPRVSWNRFVLFCGSASLHLAAQMGTCKFFTNICMFVRYSYEIPYVWPLLKQLLGDYNSNGFEWIAKDYENCFPTDLNHNSVRLNSQLNAVLIGNPSIMGFIVPAYSHLFETICLWQLR